MDQRPWHKHWPKGQPFSINYPEVSVDIILRTTERRFPNRPAVVFQGVEYTYSDIWEGAQRFSAALFDMGIGKGDVVSLHLINCPQFAMAYYGIVLSGAIYSPANPLLSTRELEYQLNDCGAIAVVTFDMYAETLLKVRANTGLRHVIITNMAEGTIREPMNTSDLCNDAISFQHLLNTHLPEPPKVDINPKEDLVHLAYTGGTTGLSKGVMLTHYNVVSSVLQGYLWGASGEPVVRDSILEIENKVQDSPGTHWEYDKEDGTGVMVNVTPWFHAMGTIGYLNMNFFRGFTTILHMRFEPIAYLDDAEKYKATYMGGAPPVYLALLNTPDFHKRDFRHIKRVASGAAPLAVDLMDRLHDAFPDAIINEAYGLTESTLITTSNPSNWNGLRKVGSVGIPLYDTEVKIVDIETGNRELAVGESGEVCIKGPQVMQGYYNKPDATAETLRDGWLHTGDIGCFDEDGYLSIVDRKKDMLIYKGYNVYPRELEELLFQHSNVVNCTVIGVPDPMVGEYPKAFVVKHPEKDVDKEALMTYVNKQVAPYKKLRDIEFIKEIPVSAAGKVLKRELRDRERES